MSSNKVERKLIAVPALIGSVVVGIIGKKSILLGREVRLLGRGEIDWNPFPKIR